jgi:NAD kinase
MRSAQRYLRQVAALLALTTNVGQAFLSHQRPPSFATRRSVDLHSTRKEATNGESQSRLPIIKGVNATASASASMTATTRPKKRKMALVWCNNEYCKDVVRERVVGDHNQIILNGPATGQVAYNWNGKPSLKEERQFPTTCAVLLLVKPNDEELMQVAAKAVRELTALDIEVLLVPDLAAKLNHYYGVNDNRISLFEPEMFANLGEQSANDDGGKWSDDTLSDGFTPYPDLVCTLGGDGLLMHASMMFQGPVPPIISIAGGSLGFLTPFSKDEMVDAVRIALGVVKSKDTPGDSAESSSDEFDVFPPNMPSYPYEPLVKAPHARYSTPKFSFGLGDSICLTIRMRLECSIISREGTVKAKYNVLNEVVIDRGSSPYLAALECFCDDVHLTTVQADGVIFAT